MQRKAGEKERQREVEDRERKRQKRIGYEKIRNKENIYVS